MSQFLFLYLYNINNKIIATLVLCLAEMWRASQKVSVFDFIIIIIIDVQEMIVYYFSGMCVAVSNVRVIIKVTTKEKGSSP